MSSVPAPAPMPASIAIAPIWPSALRQLILPLGVFVLGWPLATALLGVSAEVFLGYLLATALPLMLGGRDPNPTTATGNPVLRFLIGVIVVGFVASVAMMVGALGLLGAYMMIRTLAGSGPIPLPWHALLFGLLGLIWFSVDQIKLIRDEHRQERAAELQRLRMLETLYKVVVVANVFLFGGMFASKLGTDGLRYVIPVCALGFVWAEWLVRRQRRAAFTPLPPMPPKPVHRDEREDYC